MPCCGPPPVADQGGLKPRPVNVRLFLEAIRPRQWVKNAFLLAPLVFGLKLTDPEALTRTAFAFFAFCLAASSAYLVNDLVDRKKDLHNPRTRHRPIARGLVPPRMAAAWALVLAASAGFLGIGTGAFAFIVAYLLLSQAYNVMLKPVPLLDIVALVSLYLIRLLAGSAAAAVPPSPWLLTCGGLLALVLALGKRLVEPRPRYPQRALTLALAASILVTWAAYLAYTLVASRRLALGTGILATNLPVLVGLARYWVLVRSGRGDPSEAIWCDRALQASVVLWVAMILGLTLKATHLVP